ncbi:MAG TPA: LamG domain-containing protein [Bacteroidota bacterium]|nr:LamG domain-containing protein [Bacteroidota bacterium]
MNKRISKTIVPLLAAILSSQSVCTAQSQITGKDTTLHQNQTTVELSPGLLNSVESKDVTREGNPQTIDSPHGKAASFDGVRDGLFIHSNPIENLRQFTIELFFFPAPQGPHEQRFFHIGEVSGSRLLLETRVTDDQWYLDAFIKSGDSSRTLIDQKLTHPTGRWFHLAFVVDNGTMDTYVDGEHELNGRVDFTPLNGGMMALGVRMNKVSWFKGAIARIRITPSCLQPAGFMKQ